MTTNNNTTKRERLDTHEPVREEEPTSLLSCLDRVPLEILAEILFYVNSPKDILSLARCSKHLCTTLLNPSNAMIWRRARRNCVVPNIPPPLPCWSESAYAAFIFDSGNCRICHGSTNRMFWSFVARVRLCGKSECRKKFFDDHVAVQSCPHPGRSESESRFYQERLRYLEMPVLSFAGASYHYLRNDQYLGLWADVLETTSEYDRMIARGESQDEYLRLLKPDLRRQRQILDHAKTLYQWSQEWSHRYRATKVSNMAFAEKLAAEGGWDLKDLLNATTYESLHRSYNMCLETISEGDVRLLLTKIDAEILSRVENEERRRREHAQQTRRAGISRYYNHLVKEKNHPVVPVLAEFRLLPIIKALQDGNDVPVLSDLTPSSSAKLAITPRILESELKRSKLLGGMIDSNLKKWVDAALVAFDSILGQPDWKSASTRWLHPAERVTARFVCTLCSKKGADKSLSFREACAHQCAHLSRKAAAKEKWKADQFIPDLKAINVLSQALSLLGLKVENRETEAAVKLDDARFLCKSCDSPIVMNFQRLVGHCRRHDTMRVEIVPEIEALLRVEHPYHAGSFAEYTARTKEAEKMRQLKVFGCRHCQNRSPEPKAARPSKDDDGPSQKRFTFNGLVSHLKEKHRILCLGDEDFFRDVDAVSNRKLS